MNAAKPAMVQKKSKKMAKKKSKRADSHAATPDRPRSNTQPGTPTENSGGTTGSPGRDTTTSAKAAPTKPNTTAQPGTPTDSMGNAAPSPAPTPR